MSVIKGGKEKTEPTPNSLATKTFGAKDANLLFGQNSNVVGVGAGIGSGLELVCFFNNGNINNKSNNSNDKNNI